MELQPSVWDQRQPYPEAVEFTTGQLCLSHPMLACGGLLVHSLLIPAPMGTLSIVQFSPCLSQALCLFMHPQASWLLQKPADPFLVAASSAPSPGNSFGCRLNLFESVLQQGCFLTLWGLVCLQLFAFSSIRK